LARIKDRKQKDRLFEREGYLKKVRNLFNAFSGDGIIHLNGNQSPDELFSMIENIVMDRIGDLIMPSP
jgi:thymidylate kinase